MAVAVAVALGDIVGVPAAEAVVPAGDVAFPVAAVAVVVVVVVVLADVGAASAVDTRDYYQDHSHPGSQIGKHESDGEVCSSPSKRHSPPVSGFGPQVAPVAFANAASVAVLLFLAATMTIESRF